MVDPAAYWSSGLNGERIHRALGRWKVDALSGDLYRFMDIDDPDLELIRDAFQIHIPTKLRSLHKNNVFLTLILPLYQAAFFIKSDPIA